MNVKSQCVAARRWTETFLGLCLSLSCFAAQQPQWIAAVAVPSADQPSVFVRSFELPQAPAKALVRLDAHDRYRLAVNGRAVSVGDTPWDAETYDVTALVRQGSNTLTVTADAETPNPKNCFIWLRHPLSAPAPFTRLSFKTRGARADEWLYVEVVDNRGRTSGFYCVERKRPDLMLGHGGKEAEHVIELGKEPTLDYRPQSGDGSGCDFTKIVSVGIRMDRKDAWVNPSGQVEFAAVKLQGPKEADLSDAAGWRLEPGAGGSRCSKLERGADGYFVLRYDFTPAGDPQVVIDFCAWGPTGALTRVSSGPGWCANGAPARVADMPLDPFAWTPLDIAGPDEKARPPLAAGVTLDVGKGNGIAGLGHTVRVQVWACEALPGASVHVRAENWAGDEVMSRDVPVTWHGAVGRAELTTPAMSPTIFSMDSWMAVRSTVLLWAFTTSF